MVDKMNQRLASEECSHLNDEQRASCLKSYEAAKAYFDKVEADRQAKADHQDPAYKLNDITAMILNFHTETNTILSIPKPKPAEPKAEDAPMKDEEKKEQGPEEPPAAAAPEGEEKKTE